MKNNEVKQTILDVIYNWARAPVKVEFVSPIGFYGINDDGYDQYITAVKISLSETVHRWHWVVISEVDKGASGLGLHPVFLFKKVFTIPLMKLVIFS